MNRHSLLLTAALALLPASSAAFERATHGYLSYAAYQRLLAERGDVFIVLGIINAPDAFSGPEYFDIAGATIRTRLANDWDRARPSCSASAPFRCLRTSTVVSRLALTIMFPNP